MFKRIDQSPRLIALLTNTSDFFAKRKGLPIVVGILLVFISLIVQSVDVFAESRALELIGVLTQNGGILTALIGLLLINPLGKF